MSIYDKASLVLIPSGTKTSKVFSQKPVNGDGDFTFSRSTAATRINADGNIEKETQNLLLQSNFSSSWSAPVATMTGGQNGYDGSSDAWLLSATGNFARIEQTNSSNGVVTLSVYAKAGTADWIMLRLTGSGFNDQQYFDLANGTIGINRGCIAADIEDVGGGWYRCSATTSGPTLQYAIMYIALADGNLSPTNENIYIQDAQLEQGLVARDYIETTTAAVEGGITDNVPRLDYTDSSCPALLLEPQRTNLFAQSEWSGGWTIENATADYNNAISPEGVQNAVLLTANGGSQDHTTYLETSSLSPNTYTFTAFIKKGTQRYVHLTLNERFVDSKWITATFDLDELTSADHSSGTGYVDGTSDITDYGNDWYRLQMTGALVNTTTYLAFVGWSNGLGAPNTSRGRYNVTTSGSFYAYGAQLEAGSYATSYIPTYGTSVTRNGDDCSTSNVEELIGQTEGTIFYQGLVEKTTGNDGHAIAFTQDANGNGSSRFLLYRSNATGNMKVYFQNTSGVAFGQATLPIPTSSNDKYAIAYSTNDLAIYVNGVLEHTQSVGVIPTTKFVNINKWTGNIKHKNECRNVLLFKTRLSNEELADLTT